MHWHQRAVRVWCAVTLVAVVVWIWLAGYSITRRLKSVMRFSASSTALIAMSAGSAALLEEKRMTACRRLLMV